MLTACGGSSCDVYKAPAEAATLRWGNWPLYLDYDEECAYYPTLDKFSRENILNSQYSENFSSLMAFEAARARNLYHEAIEALPERDRRAQRPGLMMAAIYHALLDEIEDEKWQVLDQRISLTPLRKFWLAWKNFVGSGRSVLNQIRRSSHKT